MIDKLKNLYSMKNTGYVVVSRSAFAALLAMIASHNLISAYGWLLYQAQFGIGYTSQGLKLKRGEFQFSIKNFQEFLDSGKTYAYKLFHRLETDGLVECIDKANSHYRLPYYEEHCCNYIHRTKTPDTPARTREECFDEFFGYYHFALNLPERERERARKEWYRLTPDEQEQAMEYIETYSETLPKPEHAKLACNYLKDKTYKG